MTASDAHTNRQFPDEYRDFKDAIDEGTSDALLAYLLKHPESPFRDVIILKLSQLKAGVKVDEDALTHRSVPHRQKGRGLFTFLTGAATSAVVILAAGYGTLRLIEPSSYAQLVTHDTENITYRSEALIRSSHAFDSRTFSDGEAQEAIRAALALSSDEIQADTRLLSALEKTVDSFFSAERFDLVEQLEMAHGELFKRDARFYVSFCLSYGLYIISTPSEGESIWTVKNIEEFDKAVAKFEEYSTLANVRRQFPEYAVMFNPFVLKLRGEDDQTIIDQMNAVGSLETADLRNFTRTMEIYATGQYANNPGRPSVQIASSRIRDLISTYYSEDRSGQWRRVGLLAGLDI